MTDANPRSTVLSVDGIGAYDTISQRAMLSGLVRHMEGSCCSCCSFMDPHLPFCGILKGRLLFWRHPRGGLVPRGRLQEQLRQFSAGNWVSMLERSLEAAVQGQKDTLERRVVRAMGLAQLGELSNARHALEGEAY